MSFFGDAISDVGGAISDVTGGGKFGTQNQTQIANPNQQMNQNAFQYSGGAGGAQARQNQLSGLGVAGASTAGQQPYQNAQLSALQQAQNEANGQDFGATQAQLNQGMAAAQAGAASQAAGARGGGANLAAAQNQAANTQGAQAASAGNQAAQLRAQMQQQGVQNLNSFASGGLGQQMQQNQFNANLQQGYEGMNNQIGLAQLQAQQNQQQLQSQNTLASQGQASQQQAGNASTNAGILGGLMGGAGGAVGALASASDARGKNSIQGESGGRYMSSPIEAKTGVSGESSWMPGMGAGSQGVGQGQLASMDSHIANFGKEAPGIQTWQNVSMAKPWSPESSAADANANKFFFSSDEDQKEAISSQSNAKEERGDVGGAISAASKGLGKMGGTAPTTHEIDPIHAGYHSIWKDVTSDTRAKRQAVQESADEKALAKLQGDVGGKRNGFEWMRDQPTAIDMAKQPPSAADEYMATARPYTYDYKNPAENGGERRLGIMAQNLEQGPTGGDLVKDTPSGKVVDVPALASANSAAVGRLHDRVTALEASQAPEQVTGAAPVMPAGAPNLSPQLAPEEHGIFSAYDNNTKLRSDTKAKKDAIFQSGVAAGAQSLAPDDRTVVIKHAAGSPEMDDAWRRAIVAQREPPQYHQLPPPPMPAPPPMPNPQDDRIARQLADYNAQSDASMRAAAQGHPASFQPAMVAQRNPAPSGGVFAQRAR